MRRTAFPSFLTWKYSRLEVRLRHYAAGLRCIRLYRISALWVVVFLGYRIGRSARLRRRSGCGRCCWCGGSVGERRGGWSIWSLRSGRLSMLDEADLARDDLRRALDKYDGERGLYRFIQLMWGIVEPETPFVGGWALEGWCEHLEAVTRGDITRLLGNVPPGYSKALWDEEPVLTTWGWKRHGDLLVGDFVFGADGFPRRVLGVTVPWEAETFAVGFDDGSEIVAAGDHLWSIERDVMSVRPRYCRGRKPMV